MIYDIIQSLDFFKGLNQLQIDEIVNMDAHFIYYDPGEVIVKEKDTSQAFYILIKGTVSVKKGTFNTQIGKLYPGEFFGDFSFLTDTPRTASVIADDVVIVIRVDRKMLSGLNIEIREKIKDRIIVDLIKRLERMNNEFIKHSVFTVHLD